MNSDRVAMPEWAKIMLSSQNLDAPYIDPYVTESDIQLQTRGMLEKRRKELDKDASSATPAIPRFHFQNRKSDMNSQLLKLARARFLQSKQQDVLLEEDLERLAYLLTENRSPPSDGQERINYDQFCAVCKYMPEKSHLFFTPQTFLKFPRDAYGRISTYELFQYICRKVNFYQARIQLSVYDEEGKGYLSEHDLETYVYELIPSLAPLKALQENFYPFYVFTAVRKFLFFLDSKRTGKVAVKNILTSPILSELLDLRSESWNEESDFSKKNWFSPSNALRVYSRYLDLDVDHDGMLSKGELQRYGIGSFTEVFIDRVFQECHTYDGKMDYKTFLDFVLAIENNKTIQGLQYFWRILDVDHCGYINTFTINYFLREIVHRMGDSGISHVRINDVIDEIFDMINPTNPCQITLEDLIRCNVGDIIVVMLTDTNGFWAYDNRESLISSPDDEQES